MDSPRSPPDRNHSSLSLSDIFGRTTNSPQYLDSNQLVSMISLSSYKDVVVFRSFQRLTIGPLIKTRSR